MKIYENNKKNGFTIETCTSLSGITVNLLIGATNTDLDILRDTLKYFDQIHASSKFIFIEFIIKKNSKQFKYSTFSSIKWSQFGQ